MSSRFLGAFKIKALAYSGVCMALATVLSLIPIFKFPYGGSVTLCSMFFVAIIGWWFGPVVGIAAGVAYGMLQFILEPWFLTPAQLLLDYPLAFGALGLMGFFRKSKSPAAFYKGFAVAALGRAFFHYWSGIAFFSEYMWEGWNMWVWSAAYNFGYIGPEFFITVIIISVPAVEHALKRIEPK
jgi:thiamine transporter